MECEKCEEKTEAIYVLYEKQLDGKLDIMVCPACAEKSKCFCKKHKRARIRLGINELICIGCLMEITANKIKDIDFIFNRLKNGLPKNEFKRLCNWAGDENFSPNDHGIAILKLLSIIALEKDKKVDEIIDGIINDKSVNEIVPNWY